MDSINHFQIVESDKKYILGSDPGANGAIALLAVDIDFNNIKQDDIILIPAKTVEGKLDVEFFIDSLKNYADNIQLTLIEDVHSLPGMSASSNFSFGDALASLRVALTLLGKVHNTKMLSPMKVAPKTWQNIAWNKDSDYVGNPIIDKKSNKPKIKKDGSIMQKTDTKATSLNSARRLFPNVSFIKNSRCSREHDGCIDALLIAYYGYVKFKRLSA